MISTVDFGNVPMAAKGTVVGVEKEKLDICWDFAFMHATNLDGLCSSPRGCSVEKFTVLNLTNVQPPYALEKKIELPKQKQNSYLPPQRPKANQWEKGAPRPIQNEQRQMENMLKTMLHINPANGNGVVHNHNGGHPMYPPAQMGGWQPPLMIPPGQHPQMMDPNAPSFVPLEPTSYDSSWRPPVPIASSTASLPPQSYDEMTMQLLSVLHANPAPPSGSQQHQPPNGNQNGSGQKGDGNHGHHNSQRGGRGRGSRNQNTHDQQSSSERAPQNNGEKPRKQFVLKKKGEQ